MPIDIHEYHRSKINAIARKAGVPEELIEPKSIKYGAEYSFPANMRWELEENSVKIFEKFNTYMAERYEDAITQTIAVEAKKEGATKVAVLDKWKILKALAAADPEMFPDMRRVVYCENCVSCRTDSYGHLYCMNPEGLDYPRCDSYCCHGERKLE